MQSYCTASAQSSGTGLLPDNFWKNVTLASGTDNGKWIQCLSLFFGFRFLNIDLISVTGCIRPETVDRLNPDDTGGQYDSSGGDGGQGNPQGSQCTECVS
jgi:hypothetical protein